MQVKYWSNNLGADIGSNGEMANIGRGQWRVIMRRGNKIVKNIRIVQSNLDAMLCIIPTPEDIAYALKNAI